MWFREALLRELYTLEAEKGLWSFIFSFELLSTVLGGFNLDLSEIISVGAVGITIWWIYEEIVIGSFSLLVSSYVIVGLNLFRFNFLFPLLRDLI